ncbi:UNVERIFIED_CONTAM: Molybdopterin synthase sulfur carrier subunit, partial [Eudyptes pachyrhynchus]
FSSGRRRRREPAAEGSPPGDRGSMRCQVVVQYFARRAELVGLRSENLLVPQQITSLQLWEEIVKIHPRYLGKSLLRCTKFNMVPVVFAVQQVYVLLGDQFLVLQPRDKVTIISISGG